MLRLGCWLISFSALRGVRWRVRGERKGEEGEGEGRGRKKRGVQEVCGFNEKASEPLTPEKKKRNKKRERLAIAIDRH